MADVNVLRTTGSVKDILEKLPTDMQMNHLFIADLDNDLVQGSHEIGDLLFNSDSTTRFAIIAKNHVADKLIIPAVRVGIINLLKKLIEDDSIKSGIIISTHQFSSEKEELEFIATIRELAMTYFGEVLKENINLVIAEKEGLLDSIEKYSMEVLNITKF